MDYINYCSRKHIFAHAESFCRGNTGHDKVTLFKKFKAEKNWLATNHALDVFFCDLRDGGGRLEEGIYFSQFP